MKKLLFVSSIAVLILSTQILFAQETKVEKTISAGVLNGKAISLPMPKYPEFAEGKTIQGTVTVEVIINEEGNVETANAVSGHPALRKVSTDAALQAKFPATSIEGKPVKVQGVIIYNFGNVQPKARVNSEGEPSLGVINGLASSLPKPDYPPAAKAVCAAGMVNVKVEISTNGDVLSAEVLQGHPLLRASSVEAAKKAKFSFMHTPKGKTSGILVYKFASGTECNSETT